MTDNGISVQVALRIRPLVDSEVSRGCQLCLDTVSNEPQVQVRGTDRAFTYNFVFAPEHSQTYIYDSAVKDLVTKLFKGKTETKSIHKFTLIIYCSIF
jgi:kinesin family protein 4/21/27